MDLKVYQKAEDREDSTEVVFSEHTDAEHLMTDTDVVTPVVKRILQSMKHGEISSTRVLPQYVEENDPEFKTRHPEY